MTGDMRAYTTKISHVEGHNFEYWEARDSQGIEGICGCLRREFLETVCNLITLSVNENPKAVDYDPSFSYPQTLLGFRDDAFSKS